MQQSRVFWKENTVPWNFDSLWDVTNTRNRHWMWRCTSESTNQLPVRDHWHWNSVYHFPSHCGMKVRASCQHYSDNLPWLDSCLLSFGIYYSYYAHTHTVMELCGDDLGDLSALELSSADDMQFQVVDETEYDDGTSGSDSGLEEDDDDFYLWNGSNRTI